MEEKIEKKLWYAVMRDETDNDWGNGSYDLEKAKEMLFGEKSYIAVIEETYINNEFRDEYNHCIDEIRF